MTDSIAETENRLIFTRTQVTFVAQGDAGAVQSTRIRLGDPYLRARMRAATVRVRALIPTPPVVLVLPPDLVLCAECPPGIDAGPGLAEVVAEALGRVAAEDLHTRVLSHGGERFIIAAERSVLDEVVDFARTHGLAPVTILAATREGLGGGEMELLRLTEAEVAAPAEAEAPQGLDTIPLPDAFQRALLKRRVPEFRKLAPSKWTAHQSSWAKGLLPRQPSLKAQGNLPDSDVLRRVKPALSGTDTALRAGALMPKVMRGIAAAGRRLGSSLRRQTRAVGRIRNGLQQAVVSAPGRLKRMHSPSDRRAQTAIAGLASRYRRLSRGLGRTGAAVGSTVGVTVRAAARSIGVVRQRVQSQIRRGLRRVNALGTGLASGGRRARRWGEEQVHRDIRQPARHMVRTLERTLRVLSATPGRLSRNVERRARALVGAAASALGGAVRLVGLGLAWAGRRQQAALRNGASALSDRLVAPLRGSGLLGGLAVGAIALILLGAFGVWRIVPGTSPSGTGEISLAAASKHPDSALLPARTIAPMIQFDEPEPLAALISEELALPVPSETDRLPDLAQAPEDPRALDLRLAEGQAVGASSSAPRPAQVTTPPADPAEAAQAEAPAAAAAPEVEVAAVASAPSAPVAAPRPAQVTTPPADPVAEAQAEAPMSAPEVEAAAVVLVPPGPVELAPMTAPRPRPRPAMVAGLSNGAGVPEVAPDRASTGVVLSEGLERSPRPVARQLAQRPASASSPETAPAPANAAGLRVLAIVGTGQGRQALVQIGANRTTVFVAGERTPLGRVVEVRSDGVLLRAESGDILLTLDQGTGIPSRSWP